MNQSYSRSKNVDIKIYPKKCFDVSIGEQEKSFRMVTQQKTRVTKHHSRSLRKLIAKGEYMPIPKTYQTPYGLRYESFDRQVSHMGYKIIPIKIPHDPTEMIYPLYMKSKKHKAPCGASIDYFKNYLQYIKDLSDEDLLSHINISFKYPYMVRKEYYGMETYHLFNQFRTKNILKRVIIYSQDKGKFINLVPIIEVQCPCSIMGESHCNKKVNLITFMYLNNEGNDEFINWIIESFITPILSRYIDIQKVVDISITSSPVSNPKKKKTIYYQLRNVVCYSCLLHQSCVHFKVTKSTKVSKHEKKVIKYSYNHVCKSCKVTMCADCGNPSTLHKKIKSVIVCPPKIVCSKPCAEELEKIQQALMEDNVETAHCPKCNNLVTKDENCDKVRCGAIDGGGRQGCGTHFCFRCGDDITHLGHNYLEHLVVTMKPDGSMTHWVCKKFCKRCPSCNAGQYWDGETNIITCGQCHIEFNLHDDAPAAPPIDDDDDPAQFLQWGGAGGI